MKNEAEQQTSIALIKVQVLDLADRFDTLEQTQNNQNMMLNYLVNAVRRMESVNFMQPPQSPVPMERQDNLKASDASFRKQKLNVSD